MVGAPGVGRLGAFARGRVVGRLAGLRRRLSQLLPGGGYEVGETDSPRGHARARGHPSRPAGATGYSAYAPSKFAVRGLMECLRNEVRRRRRGRRRRRRRAGARLRLKRVCLMCACRRRRAPVKRLARWGRLANGVPRRPLRHLALLLTTPSLRPTRSACVPPPLVPRPQLQGSNVRVSIAYPPDMDTPGYQREGLTKVRSRPRLVFDSGRSTRAAASPRAP